MSESDAGKITGERGRGMMISTELCSVRPSVPGRGRSYCGLQMCTNESKKRKERTFQAGSRLPREWVALLTIKPKLEIMTSSSSRYGSFKILQDSCSTLNIIYNISDKELHLVKSMTSVWVM